MLEDFGESDETRRDRSPDVSVCLAQCPAAAAAVVQPGDKNVLRNCEKPLVQHSVLTFVSREIMNWKIQESTRTWANI